MEDRRSGAVWVPAWAILAAVAAVVFRAELLPVRWWLPAAAAVPAAVVTLVATFAVDRPRHVPHRVVATLAGCGWVSWVGWHGWGQWTICGFLLAVVLLAAVEVLADRLGSRHTAGVLLPDTGEDRRPAPIREWEALLNRLASRTTGGAGKQRIVVRDIVPWASKRDGLQVHVDLPEDMTPDDLARLNIAGARRLPRGCTVRVLDADHQGAAVLDVMLRDCLAEPITVDEPTGPASINDEFPIAHTPRGQTLDVCLRQKSMVVGGTVGSGKTTFLHRIVRFLARCTDTLVWVIDLNGGGVAEPWVSPWARGETPAPVVDWIADTPEEALVMVAVAKAIAKDRKTSKEATRLRHAANSGVLPVSPRLPAIVIVVDEGGEVRQSGGLIGTLLNEGIARVAQIARAEGVRVIMSVLRGTATLLNKDLRSVASLRVCLRMDEDTEYTHIIDANPGRTQLLHVGSAWVRRIGQDPRPVLARTVNVDLRGIVAHAIDCGPLRPTLDDRARHVASRVTVREVLDGRDPRDHPDIARHPVMRAVEAGEAYAGRWARKASMLAQMRGEDVAEPEPVREEVPERPTAAAAGSSLERLLLAGRRYSRTNPTTPPPTAPVSEDDTAAVLLSDEHMARDGHNPADPVTPATAREAILAVLRADGGPLTAAQVRSRMSVDVSAQRVYQLLVALVDKGSVVKVGDGYQLAPATAP